MKCYRIDNREKSIGAILFSQGVYQSSLNKEKLDVERLLESNRPKDKPKRDSILMLFSDFNSAKNHWLNQKNSKFYELKIENHDILHKGDYKIVEQIYYYLQAQNENDAQCLAKEYWASKITEKSVIEIFVNQAKITRIISTSEEERKNEFLFKHRNIAPDIRPNPNIKRIMDSS